MRHTSGPEVSAEKTVKDIRRATRKRHATEEKIRIVLEGLRGESGRWFMLNDGGPDLRCFNTLSVSDNKFVYSDIPRGNTLTYTKSGD